MKLILSTVSFSTLDPIILDCDPGGTDFMNAARRVGRTATLDGGCLITDSGFSHSDRTFKVRASVDEATEINLWDWFQTYALLNIATREGVFVGAIESCTIKKGALDMSILVKEKK